MRKIHINRIYCAGFTLVELMVVVAIIGILAAIAVPNFRKYQAKARSADAPLALAAIYTGEVTVFSQFNTYVACVKLLMVTPPTSSYYVTGFHDALNLGKSMPLNLKNCDASTTPQTIAAVTSTGYENTDTLILPLAAVGGNGGGLKIPGSRAPQMSDFAANTTLSGDNTTDGDTFTAAAVGSVAANGLVDIQIVNQKKEIRTTSVGY